MLNRPVMLLTISIFLCLICAAPLMAKTIDRYTEYIATNNSIAIGGIFYAKETWTPGYRAQYTHMGFDGGDLKVKYELIYHTDEVLEVEYYTLMLNGKDALLVTKPLFGEDPEDVTKLLISVVDGFGRIRAQEFRGD
ncbi:MAG: hypothetical protein ABH875_06115 [Candidatus Omnitrophota bacterium]